MGLNRSQLPGRQFWNSPVSVGSAVIATVAVLSTTLHFRGLTIADARLEHILEPGQFLKRHLSIWDDQRGAGTPAVYFSPVVSTLQVLLRAVGINSWLIGRLTLAIYLSVAGIGAQRLALRIGPRAEMLAFFSGLLYAFNPFSSQFIIPSGLFVPAVALPWLLLITINGILGDRPWRDAARFALFIFAVGMLNTASLLFTLLPVALFAVLLVTLESHLRSETSARHGVGEWSSLIAFAWRTVLLSVLVSAAMLVVLYGSRGAISRNLATTELPSVVASTATAGESWRGLGGWLTYFKFGNVGRPGAEAYFTSQPLILLSYLPAGAAIIGAVTRRVSYWRSWLLLMCLGILLMVGANQVVRTPLSSFFGWMFETFPSARAFRSGYKAGSGVWLAIAMLAPAGGVAVGRWVRRQIRLIVPSPRLEGAIAILVVCGAGLFPFASGRIFNEKDSYRRIPEYWMQFFNDMAAYPQDRILVFPSASRYRYDWGYVNDNLFDAMLGPSALFGQTVSGSTASLANVIDEIDAKISSNQMEPESLAPMLKAVGAQWFLVQYDVAIPSTKFPERLKEAPGIVRVATYASDDADEKIELYRVDGSDLLSASWATVAPLIVSGGEGTLSSIALMRWLDSPVVNMATLDERTEDDLIARGAEIVVSDGAQRRGVTRGITKRESVPLEAWVHPSRPILTASPDDSATQTVLEISNVAIESDGVLGPEKWQSGSQPSLMFDDSVYSGWSRDTERDSLSEFSFNLRLDSPQFVEQLVLEPLAGVAGSITSIRLTQFDTNGDAFDFDYVLKRYRPTTIPIKRDIQGLMITVTGVAGEGRAGIGELSLIATNGQIDTQAGLRLPIEITQLRRSVDVPVSYLFSALDETMEEKLRRWFTTVKEQTFEVRARLVTRRTVNKPANSCVALFEIDNRPVLVRPVKGHSWQEDVVDVEGCVPIRLSAGQHWLAEPTNLTQSLRVIALVDHLSTLDLGKNKKERKIVDERISASRHSFEIPAGEGFLSTSIPFHPGWTAIGAGRHFEALDTFVGTAWSVTDGDAGRVDAIFSLQRVFQIALVVTGCSLVICVSLARPRWRKR